MTETLFSVLGIQWTNHYYNQRLNIAFDVQHSLASKFLWAGIIILSICVIWMMMHCKLVTQYNCAWMMCGKWKHNNKLKKRRGGGSNSGAVSWMKWCLPDWNVSPEIYDHSLGTASSIYERRVCRCFLWKMKKHKYHEWTRELIFNICPDFVLFFNFSFSYYFIRNTNWTCVGMCQRYYMRYRRDSNDFNVSFSLIMAI